MPSDVNNKRYVLHSFQLMTSLFTCDVTDRYLGFIWKLGSYSSFNGIFYTLSVKCLPQGQEHSREILTVFAGLCWKQSLGPGLTCSEAMMTFM